MPTHIYIYIYIYIHCCLDRLHLHRFSCSFEPVGCLHATNIAQFRLAYSIQDPLDHFDVFSYSSCRSPCALIDEQKRNKFKIQLNGLCKFRLVGISISNRGFEGAHHRTFYNNVNIFQNDVPISLTSRGMEIKVRYTISKCWYFLQ